MCVCVVGEQEGQTLGLLTIKTFPYSQMFIEHSLCARHEGSEGRGEQRKSHRANIWRPGTEDSNTKQMNEIISVLVRVIKKTKVGYVKDDNQGRVVLR